MSLTETIKAQMRLRCHDGVLTERLVQDPASHGLGRLPNSVKPDATVNSVCGFCGTGCSLKIHLKDGEAVNLSAQTSYPVNLGMACPKGWESLTPLSAKTRATTPLLRNAQGEQEPVSWEVAMDAFVRNFKLTLKEHGAGAGAFLSTGQIVTEEMAFLGALAKLGMGMLHGDGNTRQCMATAVTAYKQSLGYDAPPFTYQDFEESDVLIFVGANPCIAHPIMWQRVMRNKRSPEIIVVDPRKTETAMAATKHWPIAPKSDLTLFYGLAAHLIDLGLIDRKFIDSHTNDFPAFSAFLKAHSIERASDKSGIAIDELNRVARLIGSGKRVSFWWTMGVNQSYEGTRLAQSLINLALMTGNIGKPGTGANSITGQCNAMGSRQFSFTTSLPALREFESAEDRLEVAEILGIPVHRIPTENSYAYNEIIDAIERGEIKALWMVATNAGHSWINQKRFRKIREKLDFFVVQDMYGNTETAQIADLVLPAAGWGEKDGVFINSERRIGVTRKVRKAPGQALSDFNIFRLIAHHWGCADLFKDWQSPEAVFRILAKLSKGRPCDFSGVSGYEFLDVHGGVQWPLPEGVVNFECERRLFEDGRFYHSNGKARFLYDEPRPMPEPPDSAYPFILLTGRGTSSQWHTQTRTETSDVLRKLYPESPYVEINPKDAERLNIAPEEMIQVASRRGEVAVKAVILSSLQSGQVFMPMHYPETNQLTLDSFDPHSKEPSYKACAVKIHKS
ncbi:MAG: nitrate reductase [Puniceicoccaceae bacterium]|nr:nitrate reductase [Puniceicoccaceae bacterium]